jgi:signal transduction histidine kinase
LLTLTPYVFFGIEEIQGGRITEVANGPLLPVYGLTTIALILGGIFKLIKRVLISKDILRKQVKVILLGTVITFSLLIIFNLVLPAFFNNPKFVPFGALFLFPFIAFTSYAILKQKLFRLKVVSTGIIVFVLSVVLFFEIIYTNSLSLIVFRSSVFVLSLVFGINLIRSVLREVEQREKIENLAKQLQDANEKLKNLDKLKTEFLSLASHQLRSPLTAIKGYASMLSEGAFGKLDEKKSEAVNRIYTSAQGLVNIVEDLLNISKIEQGGMKYEFMPTSLSSVVETLFNEMRVPAESKHLEFRLDMDKHDKFIVSADPVKLKQVFLNLVDNSIKYTQKGFVKISLKRLENNIVFSVSDSGMGISPETRSKLFEKFSRGEGGKTNTGGKWIRLILSSTNS